MLNITSLLIDFTLFRSQYQRRNSRSNARICCRALISCSPLVPVCRLLRWTSICY